MRFPETAGFAVDSLEMYALVCKSVGCSNKAKARFQSISTSENAYSDANCVGY
jgi:hypothetical protein